MKSVWTENIKIKSFPKLEKDIKTDVLIIGGGMAGILTAYLLSKNNIDYVLTEKNRICCQTTQNTTAKITYQHGLIFNKLLKSKGRDITQGYLNANMLAFDTLCKICGSIDCDFEIKDNFIYSTQGRKELEDEICALNSIGFSALFKENLPLPIKTSGAVCFTQQAQFHPLKFISSIVENLDIYENTFIKEMVGNTAVTDNCKISAKKVIVTTHFPFINKHGLFSLKLYQNRSYVTALKNAAQLDGMYLDADEKGLSFRNYKNLLLLGGGAHRTGQKGGNWQELRKFASINYPEAKEVIYWAAQDCMSLDSIPYIGRYSKNTNDLYVASGFNKWGMTNSMLSAILLTDFVLDKKNIYSDIFNPSRNILTPQLFINGFESVKSLLSLSAKRCPHLGCALKWNKAEHSWDCPCHGSRFDEQGKVLDNPANGNLKY